MVENSRIQELKRRVQMDPASIAFAALAEEYRRAGQFDEAIATCEAGLQRHPAYLSARVTLGRSLIEVGRYEAAEEQLEHVLRGAPENLAAIRGLAEIHHRRGELPEALEQYRSDTPPAPDAPAAAGHLSPFPLEAAPPVHSAAEIRAPQSEPKPPAVVPPLRVSHAPAEPVRVSATPASAAAQPTPARAESMSAPPPSKPTPVPLEAVVAPPPPAPGPIGRPETVTPSPVLHPDAAALPALEAFLAAIVRAKESLPSRRSEH